MSTQNPNHLYLQQADLEKLAISVDEVTHCIEAAIHQQGQQQLWCAPKASILPGDGRYMMATLSASDDPQLLAVKSVIVSPDNPQRGLPGINGSILLLDSQSGELRAVMDANWVTAVRTAGLSAVVAKRLANPAAKSIAFVGCGVQARSHLEAFSEFLPLQEVRAVGRSRGTLDKFCDFVTARGQRAKIYDSAEAALVDADIVVTSITLNYAIEPFLDARWLAPGALAIITDLAIPWHAESMNAFKHIIIDDKQQEAAMEKPMVAADLISGDIEDLITGRTPLTYQADASSAFVFRGIALGDFAVAALAYKKALAASNG